MDGTPKPGAGCDLGDRIRLEGSLGKYHQSFAQPGFRAQKKAPFLAIFCLFPCVWGEKGKIKTRTQPWYARKSGKSPAPLKVPPRFAPLIIIGAQIITLHIVIVSN